MFEALLIISIIEILECWFDELSEKRARKKVDDMFERGDVKEIAKCLEYVVETQNKQNAQNNKSNKRKSQNNNKKNDTAYKFNNADDCADYMELRSSKWKGNADSYYKSINDDMPM